MKVNKLDLMELKKLAKYYGHKNKSLDSIGRAAIICYCMLELQEHLMKTGFKKKVRK